MTLKERIARAIHDGPLAAGNDYTFDGPSKNEQECSAWCRDVAQAALEEMIGDIDEIDAIALVYEGQHPGDVVRNTIKAAIAER